MPPATAPAGHGQGTPSFATSFTFDTLLARCAQSEWKPDPKTMLFFTTEDERAWVRNSSGPCARAFIRCARSMSLKKILVTSALPKEGKSFVAANLAQVLVRQHGRRVLLIDGDLRVAQSASRAWDDLVVRAWRIT